MKTFWSEERRICTLRDIKTQNMSICIYLGEREEGRHTHAKKMRSECTTTNVEVSSSKQNPSTYFLE
jgi:predicted phage gp36 major capsid-like protein